MPKRQAAKDNGPSKKRKRSDNTEESTETEDQQTVSEVENVSDSSPEESESLSSAILSGTEELTSGRTAGLPSTEPNDDIETGVENQEETENTTVSDDTVSAETLMHLVPTITQGDIDALSTGSDRITQFSRSSMEFFNYIPSIYQLSGRLPVYHLLRFEAVELINPQPDNIDALGAGEGCHIFPTYARHFALQTLQEPLTRLDLVNSPYKNEDGTPGDFINIKFNDHTDKYQLDEENPVGLWPGKDADTNSGEKKNQ